MAFKNLEERFLARAKTLYAHASTRDGSPDGEPYLEFKPTDPRAEETKNDSRTVPAGSVRRDAERMGKYLKSHDGLLFLLKQGILQAGNTFSETRLYNPLFVIGNTVPTLHLKRPLTGQNDFAVTGDQTQISPASMDPNVFSAGRLQKATSADAVSRAVGETGGVSGLISLLNSFQATETLASVFSTARIGTLGVNQRPELDINGEYFSVQLWKGFIKMPSPQANLSAAMANLRVGNLVGAVSSLKNAATSFIRGAQQILPAAAEKTVGGRGSTSSDFDGRRYFFEVDGVDERYLPNSINFTDKPHVSTPYLERRPYTIAINSASPSTPSAQQVSNFIPNVNTSLSTLVSSFGSFNFSNAAATANALNTLANIATAKTAIGTSAEDSAMQFTDLSLKSRYNTDSQLDFIRSTLQQQKDTSFAYWKGTKTNLQALGFIEYDKIKAGMENNLDPHVYRGGRYLSDRLGQIGVQQTTADGVTGAVLDSIQQQGGDNTVLAMFFDFINKKVVPFRAMISGLRESTAPEISDTRYVGRVERNIVYTGATRECSFQLHVFAFTKDELDVVWEKINYMTGLCFPADYSNGYMVPPLVKLTLGDIYVDQPGYLRAVSFTVDENTTWEVEGKKVPHGVTLDIQFSIIEKVQVKTGSPFYSVRT